MKTKKSPKDIFSRKLLISKLTADTLSLSKEELDRVEKVRIYLNSSNERFYKQVKASTDLFPHVLNHQSLLAGPARPQIPIKFVPARLVKR